MVNPWHSAEVRVHVEILILAVSGGKSPALKTLLAIPNTDIIGWEKLIVNIGKLYTVILNVV